MNPTHDESRDSWVARKITENDNIPNLNTMRLPNFISLSCDKWNKVRRSRVDSIAATGNYHDGARISIIGHIDKSRESNLQP